MEKSLKALSGIDVNKFYCVTLRSYGVDLQGEASYENIKYARLELGVDLTYSNENCWLSGSNGLINVTLTIR